MSDNWTFSPSSMPYLQRCIAVAPPPDPNSKWIQKFGKKVTQIESVTNENATIDKNLSNTQIESVTNETATVDKNEGNLLNTEKYAAITYEDFFDTIESESTLPVEYIMEECTKYPGLIPKMAEKLSSNTVELLFKHIYSMKDVETMFLCTFISTFLRTFIKVQYSRLCIDLLVKLNEQYPQIFKELLQTLVNDTEIPNEVLDNYIAVLNEESITSFIKTFSTIDISSEVFTQNVSMLYTAYKNCIKNDFIQNYIQKVLVQHSKPCASDRNYGRLFLTFLQSEKAMGRKGDIQILEKCLDAHRSVFRRPCLLLLKQI